MNGSAVLPPGGQPAAPKPRLLLAENESALWLFLCELLRAEYEVEVVTDGEHAWAAAQGRRPALVLSDVIMPGLDGIALTRRLRADARTATVPIVLLTSSHARDLRRRGLEAGANELLLKPFRPAELLECLRGQLAAGNPDAGRG